MSTQVSTASEPLVQPILVLKTGRHGSTIKASARASVLVRLALNAKGEVFDEWLSGPFTKSVRRASLKDLEKAKQWARENDQPFAEVQEGPSVALAFAPMTYSAYPPIVRRAQVNGTAFSPDDPKIPTAEYTFEVALLNSLTTGKAAAQAAHAVWQWALASDFERLEKLEHIALSGFAPNELTAIEAMYASHAIRDNGLTEVAPNTLTCVAREL